MQRNLRRVTGPPLGKQTKGGIQFKRHLRFVSNSLELGTATRIPCSSLKETRASERNRPPRKTAKPAPQDSASVPSVLHADQELHCRDSLSSSADLDLWLSFMEDNFYRCTIASQKFQERCSSLCASKNTFCEKSFVVDEDPGKISSFTEKNDQVSCVKGIEFPADQLASPVPGLEERFQFIMLL
ncbi:hypothetical protein NL676_024041 [Syzygium grande]|nr:hypothetical protein NL676_024041 [Syzygium grande]